ncbi:hypothetical protein KSS87_014071 [Heliosperma pusillum]|nr:hypothetical protein KSS87_014071 [Heliosperma pusillum]
MSAIDSASTTNNNHTTNFDHRCGLPTKRKLEDCDNLTSHGGDDDSTATAAVKDSPFFDSRLVKVKLEQFMALPLDKQSGFANSHFKTDYYKIFLDARAPLALVMLYRSPDKPNQDCADECIRCFVSFVKDLGGTVTECAYCAKMVLEFCRLLKMYAPFDDVLYAHCRSALGMMLDKVEMVSRPKEYSWMSNGEITSIAVQDLFPYLNELGQRLLKDLMMSAETSTGSGPSLRDVCDFSAFLQPVLSFIGRELPVIQASCNFEWQGNASLLGDEAACLSHLFDEMLTLIDKCLAKVGVCLALKRKKHDDVDQNGWSHYLAILKDLGNIALLYPDSEDRFWTVLRNNKVVVRALVVLYASRINDHSWLLKEKDILDFESRRHLAMLMFPEVREDYEELHEMLIDRSQLLAESFEYISNAEPSSLHAGLFMEFKNEEATGPGVLREWFCMVCQAIFDPQNALFVACPLDRRRFYPNPGKCIFGVTKVLKLSRTAHWGADSQIMTKTSFLLDDMASSKVDPLHIRYFRFAGRVIALALMHKIQVGVVLDRVFFLQLAGRCVSVEDIKNADPCIYNSCKQILEMDPEFVDSDGLGLAFVTEVEELGSRKAVELCCGGKSIVLNSKNRKEYVYLIVQQHFVTSISEQVSSFAQGFADILSDGNLRTTFFASLELEELDWMLHGSKSEEISVEDWKAHTEYNGYKKADPQIVWFWEQSPNFGFTILQKRVPEFLIIRFQESDKIYTHIGSSYPSPCIIVLHHYSPLPPPCSWSPTSLLCPLKPLHHSTGTTACPPHYHYYATTTQQGPLHEVHLVPASLLFSPRTPCSHPPLTTSTAHEEIWA